jgi:hypothetical protein
MQRDLGLPAVRLVSKTLQSSARYRYTAEHEGVAFVREDA